MRPADDSLSEPRCSRGNQSLHEGEAEVRGEARQQGRESATGAIKDAVI
jgi:hypothetical protein